MIIVIIANANKNVNPLWFLPFWCNAIHTPCPEKVFHKVV